jgi:hypothetical protein
MGYVRELTVLEHHLKSQEMKFNDTPFTPPLAPRKFLTKNLQVLWHAAISVMHVRLIIRLETNGGEQPHRSEVALLCSGAVMGRKASFSATGFYVVQVALPFCSYIALSYNFSFITRLL